jgi:hypothetical protein
MHAGLGIAAAVGIGAAAVLPGHLVGMVGGIVADERGVNLGPNDHALLFGAPMTMAAAPAGALGVAKGLGKLSNQKSGWIMAATAGATAAAGTGLLLHVASTNRWYD